MTFLLKSSDMQMIMEKCHSLVLSLDILQDWIYSCRLVRFFINQQVTFYTRKNSSYMIYLLLERFRIRVVTKATRELTL